MQRHTVVALCLVLVALPAPGRAAPGAPSPVVYAHRGGAAEAPENTLGAFRQAWERYGDDGVWLELDLQLAKDGALVVIHDATLTRTTDTPACEGKRVVDLTAEELRHCDVSAGWQGPNGEKWPFVEPVPTFEEVLVEGRDAGWRLLPEIKNIPGEPNFDPAGTLAADALIALVRATAFPAERIVVQSFFPTSLDRIEERAPEIGTALLTTSRLPGAPPGVGFYATENAAYATARGYEIVAPDHGSPDLRAETVELARALGRRVVVWTVNDEDDIARVLSWPVDGIISDHPARAFDALAR